MVNVLKFYMYTKVSDEMPYTSTNSAESEPYDGHIRQLLKEWSDQGYALFAIFKENNCIESME